METTTTQKEVEPVEVTNKVSPTMLLEPELDGDKTRDITPNHDKKRKQTTLCDPDRSLVSSDRRTSGVWNHYSEYLDKWGKKRAKCKYCTSNFASESTNGTSTLWRHLNEVCPNSPLRIIDRNQSRIKVVKKGEQAYSTCTVEKVVINVNEIRRAIAEFVIIDEQPFKVVEGEGFRRLMAVALPNFQLPSRLTVARQCLKIYQEEKEKLKKLIHNQRVCVTSDTWTSLQNLTYMVVTAHWIDDEWNLKKKILNFFQTSDHKGETIAKGIEACLFDWEIENIFTVTLDNATANDSAIKHLKRRIEDWKGGILGNEFLHVRCNAHILNLIVKEGLSEQNESISRVRNAIKYVKSSAGRFDSFKSFVEKVKIDTHGLLTLDIETRWNSTYMMLDTAVKFEKAFSRMYDDDHKYLKYCLETNNVGRHPSIDDWKNVKVFIKFLEIFYQVTLKFSGTSYVTSNSFFHEIFNLQKIICKYVRSEDSILSGMAKKMELKFNKYWGTFESMNKLLFIAVVLDPRYKLKYVEYLFKNSYGCLVGAEKSKKVMDTLSRLYDYYMSSFCGTHTDKIGGQTRLNDEIDTMHSDEMWQSQWEKYLADEDNTENKSELEKYLVDDLEKTKELDILAWWKVSSARYPIISRMARDVLSIPISTVASESAFSTGGRILDSYRSSLSPKTVEALICTQQWLRSTSKECKLADLLEEIQKLEIVEKEYAGTTLSID